MATQNAKALLILVLVGLAAAAPQVPSCDRINCPSGSYCDSGRCKSYSVCTSNQYEARAPTPTSDRVCYPCSTCQSGSYYTKQKCTATTNTVCAKCSTCAAGTFTDERCNSEQDTICRACGECSEGYRVSSCCSSYRNVQCIACPLGQDCGKDAFCPAVDAPSMLSVLEEVAPLFIKLLKSSNPNSYLVRMLNNTYSKLTVFAPTDDAIDAIPSSSPYLTNSTLTENLLKFHIVSSGEPIESNEFENGAIVRSYLGQGLKEGLNDRGATIGSQGETTANIVRSDIQARQGIVHLIDKVLIPVTPGTPYATCKKEVGPCYKSETCYGTYDKDCKLSKLMKYSYNGFTCCPENCIFRTNGGLGAQCQPIPVTRSLPTNPPTTKNPFPDCPETCKASFTSCVTKYNEESCLTYATNGFLCKSPATGTPLKCDAHNFLNKTGDCPDSTMTYYECMPCQRTCENPNPICPMFCRAGCGCKPETPYYDYALKKCIKPTQCPEANKCEGDIAANYLDTGNAAVTCSKTGGAALGQVCETKCATNTCQADVKHPEYDEKCGTLKTSSDCAKAKGYCKWASGGDSGPTFVCSDADDGMGAWTLQSEGDCSDSGGTEVAVCEFLTETSCLTKGKCTDDLSTQCSSLVKTTYDKCKLGCFANGLDDPKCGNCIIETLYSTNTLNLEQPDIFTCCGCLDSLFSFGTTDLNNALLAPCK